MLTIALQDKSPRLARPLALDLVQSRGQVARPPYFGRTDSSYSFLTPLYIDLIPTKFKELLERILREKP